MTNIITRKEIRLRNRSLRMLFRTKMPHSDVYSEYELMEFVITNSNEIIILKDYPYLFAVEYMVHPPYSQFGKGDLIFTNGKNHFLVVELKYLTKNSGKTAQTSRRKHRRKVEEQAFRYGICFKGQHPEYKIAALAITNENLKHKYYSNILI
ncbi:MAG: hypothetical protein ACTSVL_06175 [Promethearchaeota archaeon]